MFLCPAGNQVSSKSLSPDVPEMFDLSFSSTRAETICMSSRFFNFSTLNVLKKIKNKFSIFWHKRLVEKPTLQNLMWQTAGRFFDTRQLYHKILYLQQIFIFFYINLIYMDYAIRFVYKFGPKLVFSSSYLSRKNKVAYLSLLRHFWSHCRMLAADRWN